MHTFIKFWLYLHPQWTSLRGNYLQLCYKDVFSCHILSGLIHPANLSPPLSSMALCDPSPNFVKQKSLRQISANLFPPRKPKSKLCSKVVRSAG